MSKINYKQFKELYDNNNSDREIAEILNVTYNSVQQYRTRYKLPINRKNEDKFKLKDTSKLLELYNKGFSKQQICEKLNLKLHTLTGYYVRLGLNDFKQRINIRTQPTQNQLSIIVGAVLGDSSILKNGMINFTHSNYQKEYLEFKYNLLINLSKSEIKNYTRFDKRTNKNYYSYSFYLRPLNIFKELRNNFYKDKKEITTEILKYYNEQAMAIHYMDDGYVSKPFNIKYHHFSTNNFSIKSVKLLQEHLLNKWNLKSRIDMVGKEKNQPMLVISDKKSNLLFENLIKPYCCKSMYYKI